MSAPPHEYDATESAETLRLESFLGDAPFDTPSPPPDNAYASAGYATVGVRVIPWFTEAITQPFLPTDVPSRLHDVATVDAAAWDALPSDPRAAARHWLASPARALLLRGVDILRAMRDSAPLAPYDLSPARILRAAALTTPIPPAGRLFPVRTDPAVPESVAVEMTLGDSAFGRAAALEWLLNRSAARDPFYLAADGVRHDLRDTAPPWIERALFIHDDLDGDLRTASLALEAALLPHAALLARRLDAPDNTVANAWRIAAWLRTCLTRGPFRGGDLRLLAARVLQALPAQLPAPDDVFDPLRFAVGRDDRIDLGECAWLHAIVHHAQAEGASTRLIPSATKFLQHLARRPLPACEAAAEDAFARNRNSLQWRYPHAAPTLLARWLLTRVRAPWLKECAPEVRVAALEDMLRDPTSFGWTASAVFLEGSALSDEALAEAVAAWRDPRADALLTHLRLSMAAGLSRTLDGGDRARVIQLLPACDAAWRPFVVDALLEATPGAGPDFVGALLASLRTLVDDADASPDPRTRLNAFVMALRHVAKAPPDLITWALTTGRRSPFADNLTVRKELNRLAHLPPPRAAGGT